MTMTNRFRIRTALVTTLVISLFAGTCVSVPTKSSNVLNTKPYLIIYPNSLIPGVPLDIRVTILNATADVNVEAMLVTSSQSPPANNSITIASGQTGHILLKVPMDLPAKRYVISIKGDGGLTFNIASWIRYEKKGLTILTQTDKVRYSGGQQVKFRSAIILPNMLGYTGNATMTVYDGKGNKIQAIGPKPARNGVINDMITLSKEPEFGEWRIETSVHVSVTGTLIYNMSYESRLISFEHCIEGISSLNIHGFSQTKHFTVKPYVLPKFSVNVDVLGKNTSQVNVKVTAKYTFNTDVHGNCTVEIYTPDNSYQKLTYENQIKGSVSFIVKLSDVRVKFGQYHAALSIRAMVTDDASSITMVAEKDNFIAAHLYATTTGNLDTAHISQFDNRNTFVSGMKFYTTLAVMKDGNLVQNKTKLPITTKVTTSEVKSCILMSPPYPWREEIVTSLPQFYVDSDETGLVPLTMDVPHNADKIEFTIMSQLSSYDSITLFPLTSKGTPMLRIIPVKPHAKVGDNVTLNVTASEEITGNLIVEVYARGIALHSESVAVSSIKFTSLQVPMTSDMVPYTHIVVSHVTGSNNFMYDYAIIKVFGSAIKNQVNVTFNTTTLEPGKSVEMILSADPKSTVYVLSEDQKNRLFGTDNDIFLYELDAVSSSTGFNASTSGKNRANKRSLPAPTPPPISPLSNKYYYSGYSFMDAGIVVLPENDNILNRITYNEITNERYQYPTEYYTYYPGVFPTYVPGMIPTPASGYTYSPGVFPTYVPAMFPTALPAAAPVVRSYFPETWIWEEFQIGDSGKVSLPLTVPDSITSWVTSVFATNEKTGFGLSVSKPKITVKKDFFVTMDPPKLIVFGEEFLLQMTIFNYLDTAQKVLVQVNTSDNPSQMMESTFNVNPGDGHSTFFQITPQHIGVMKITVVARAGFFQNTAVDEVEKEVTVKPSGVHILTNEQHLVEVAVSGDVFNTSVAMLDPPNMVPGSKTAKVSITGDFMTNTIEGLEKLINMPFGCGEQTMLNFAPDIYVTKYLQAVGKLTDKIQRRAMTFMESGLQREMTYRHYDGSFSAFGNSDSSGSSWLTAFVLKCFQQADGLLEIDNDVKSRGLNWLLNYQHSDGSFFEPGRIIHTQMQAGTGSGIKLTAFILNSVLENAIHASASRVGTAIAKASTYLEKNLPNVTDMYTLAIVCYALAKSNNPSKSACLSRLESTAVHTDGKMHWLAKTKIYNMTAVSTRAATTRAPSADIEATSYSLLTYLTLGERVKAKPIIKWLISQRNPNGGFQSTQDTIISLQALALYASHGQQGSHVDFSVTGGTFKHDYSVTKANNDFMHTAEVPTSLNELIILATGQGNAVIDVTMSYYVDGIENNNLIAVQTRIISESLNAITISPCIRWNGDEASGMIVAEVEMPTGFSLDDQKLATFSIIKKHETIGQSVALYFDGFSAKQEVCTMVTFVRTDPVVKSQACHVTVYDYYEPTNQARARYESGVLKSTTICDVCPECSFCKSGGGIGQIGDGK